MFKKNKKEKSAQHTAIEQLEKEKCLTPQPNDQVKAINLAIEELTKAKVRVCTHESRFKNGVKESYLSYSLFTLREEVFNECMHCGCKLKATGWSEA